MEKDTSLTHITEKETIEFLSEGLLIAASRAKELGLILEHPIWTDIGLLCDQMRNKCLALANSKAMTRNEVLNYVNIREKNAGIVSDAQASPSKKFLLN